MIFPRASVGSIHQNDEVLQVITTASGAGKPEPRRQAGGWRNRRSSAWRSPRAYIDVHLPRHYPPVFADGPDSVADGYLICVVLDSAHPAAARATFISSCARPDAVDFLRAICSPRRRSGDAVGRRHRGLRRCMPWR